MAVENNSPSSSLSDGLLPGLELIRDQIAADLEACEAMRDKAPLYSRLVDVLARIDAAKPAEQTGDGIDEIAERRASRRASAAKGSSRAKRSG